MISHAPDPYGAVYFELRQGRYRCWVLKPDSSLDPVNLFA